MSVDYTDQLLAAIRACTGDDRVQWLGPPVRMTGGFTTEMWGVRIGGGPVGLNGDRVARIMADLETARRETVVQRHLAEAGYPTPAVRLAGDASAELPLAWLVMDRVRGQPLLDGLSGPTVVLRLPRLLQSIPEVLGGCMASLHRLPAEDVHRELGSVDEIGVLIDRMAARMDAAGRADLVSFSDELRSSRPARRREVICHGDLHPLNVLEAVEGPVVLDWSTARISDPAYDLAFTALLLSHPPLDVPRPLRAPIRSVGGTLARRFLRAYRRHGGREVDAARLEWFTRLGALRVLTELEVTADPDGHPFRHLEGVAHRLRTAAAG